MILRDAIRTQAPPSVNNVIKMKNAAFQTQFPDAPSMA
jgi:hypothetical protein